MNWEQYARQERAAAAAELMEKFSLYAASIGCTLIHDSIESHTREQVELLAAKWKELTE